MRPKLLEIEGLQSFKESQRIDFEALGETGLFGIFGPTGSGKSTVLDAITFALYGRVKRADRGTQGIINANMLTTRVSFTFELIKDGGRKTYRVERVYRRKKGTENSCEPRVVRLAEVTPAGDVPLCDKASEVSSTIEELLGLGHDDFTRAVVLPQNSFQEFLLLDNAKKKEMLERIFYLEEYGKQLSEKLNRRLYSVKSRMDRIAGELSAYADASDQSLEEAQKLTESALSERARAEEELKLLAARYEEARDVWQLVRDLAFVTERERQQLKLREAIDLKSEQLEKAVRAEGLLVIISKNNALSAKLRETESQLQEVMGSLPGVIAGLEGSRQKLGSVKSEAAAEQPRLISLRTRLADALALRADLEGMQKKLKGLRVAAAGLQNEISGRRGAIAGETEKMEALEQYLNRLGLEMEPLKTDPEYRQQIQEGVRLENEVDAIEGSVSELNDKAATLTASVAGLERELARIKEKISLSQKVLEDLNAEKQKHEGLKPEDRDSILEYTEKLHSLKSVCDVLMLRKNELDGTNTRLAGQQSDWQGLKKKVLELEEGKAKAGQLCDRLRLELGQAVRAMEQNTAHVLAKNLKEGEPCPVCGSEHHPSPAAPAGGNDLAVLERQVETAGKRLSDAERSLKEAEKEYLVANEQLKALKGLINQAAGELELKLQQYSAVQLRLPEELRALEPRQLSVELDRRRDLSSQNLKAFESWEKKQEEYGAGLQEINNRLSLDRVEENGIAAQLKVVRENMEQAQNTLQAAKEEYKGKLSGHRDFLQKYGIKSVAGELKRFAENDRRLSLLQKKKDQTQQLANSKRVLLDQLREGLQALNSESVKLEAQCGNLAEQIAEKKIRLKELAGDNGIEDQIRWIDERLEEYLRLETKYQESLKALEIKHNELTAQKTTLESQRKIYAESLQNEEDRLKNTLLEKGFADSLEVENCAIPRDRQKAWRDEIGEFEQAERNLQAQKGILLMKLDSRSITEEEWNHLSVAYQEMAAYKEECVSRSEVARNNYSMLQGKHDRWRELNKSYLALSEKHDLLEQIQRLLKGERGKDNSFIDYIAEERLRYVAARASETLGVMTKYKYALELDADAGFIIRDNANGGVHRTVNSLSGGETFLTALALALALSEQIQLKGQSPLEFFFLDEGFGTLDNNLLDTVIDSLERLSKKERVIGLISHVPELRSRIAKRLIVDPPSPRGEGSRVRIERS